MVPYLPFLEDQYQTDDSECILLLAVCLFVVFLPQFSNRAPTDPESHSHPTYQPIFTNIPKAGYICVSSNLLVPPHRPQEPMECRDFTALSDGYDLNLTKFDL